MGEHFDAIVIGGGIVGISSGYKLAKSGKRTLVLEQYDIGHSFGSSHGASRIIRYSHNPGHVYLPLAIDAFKQWDEMERITGERLILHNGLLWLGSRTGTTERSQALKNFNISHDTLAGSQINKRFPHLNYTEDKWHAVYEPNSGTILADKCLKAVQSQYIANGGIYRAKERVVRIISTDKDIVEVYTQMAKYTTKVLVVATGAWLNRILPELPIRTTAQLTGVNYWQFKDEQSAKAFRPENGSPNIVVTDVEDELYAIPCVDFKDRVKFSLHLGIGYDPEKRKMNANMRAPDWMRDIPSRHISRYLPGLESSLPASQDLCVYTMTDDINLIVDRHPHYPNILVAGGMSGIGFKFALTVGDIITEMADGAQTSSRFDLSAFKISRKILPNVKGKL